MAPVAVIPQVPQAPVSTVPTLRCQTMLPSPALSAYTDPASVDTNSRRRPPTVNASGDAKMRPSSLFVQTGARRGTLARVSDLDQAEFCSWFSPA